MKRFFIILLLLLGLLLLYGKYKQSSRVPPPEPPPSSSAEAEPSQSSPGREGPPSPRPSLLPKVEELAQAQGLEVVAAREDIPGTITLTVASREQHLLSIFLNELESSLTLQDFEAAPPKVSADRYGRKRFEVTYRIKYAVRR